MLDAAEGVRSQPDLIFQAHCALARARRVSGRARPVISHGRLWVGGFRPLFLVQLCKRKINRNSKPLFLKYVIHVTFCLKSSPTENNIIRK